MRSATIKTKGELIQVIGQLGRPNGTLVCTQKPPFKQRSNQVRQLKFLRGKDLSTKALTRQCAISQPIIRLDHASWSNHFSYKTTQAVRRGIFDCGQTNSTKTIWCFIFNGNRHQDFPFGPTSRFSRLLTPHICFVHLHEPRKLIPVRSYHGTSQTMEPFPGRLVTTQTKYSLQSQSIRSIFLAGNMPHRSKPKSQRFMSSMKNRASCNGGLSTALLAEPQTTFCLPSLLTVTGRTYESVRPAHLSKVFPAGLFGSKSFFKLSQGSWIIFHDPKYYYW